MSDLISRDAVLGLKTVAPIAPVMNGEAVHYEEVVFVRDLEKLTSVWIPVSERPPEVGSEVLVCFDFKGRRSVYISHFYGDGEFHGLDDEYLTPDGRKYRKAVAWMPLPEPYKAKSEDKV